MSSSSSIHLNNNNNNNNNNHNNNNNTYHHHHHHHNPNIETTATTQQPQPITNTISTDQFDSSNHYNNPSSQTNHQHHNTNFNLDQDTIHQIIPFLTSSSLFDSHFNQMIIPSISTNDQIITTMTNPITTTTTSSSSSSPNSPNSPPSSVVNHHHHHQPNESPFNQTTSSTSSSLIITHPPINIRSFISSIPSSEPYPPINPSEPLKRKRTDPTPNLYDPNLQLTTRQPYTSSPLQTHPISISPRTSSHSINHPDSNLIIRSRPDQSPNPITDPSPHHGLPSTRVPPQPPAPAQNVPVQEFTKRKDWEPKLMEDVMDTIQLISPDGEILYVSPSIRSLTGYERNEWISESFYTWCYDIEDRANFRRWVEDSIRSLETIEGFLRVRKKDGGFLILEVGGHIIRPDEQQNRPTIFLSGRKYPSSGSKLTDRVLELKLENHRMMIELGHHHSTEQQGTNQIEDEKNLRKLSIVPTTSSNHKHPLEGLEFVCMDCGTTVSPEWRKGPGGPKTLCNACGLRWAKKPKPSINLTEPTRSSSNWTIDTNLSSPTS